MGRGRDKGRGSKKTGGERTGEKGVTMEGQEGWEGQEWKQREEGRKGEKGEGKGRENLTPTVISKSQRL